MKLDDKLQKQRHESHRKENAVMILCFIYAGVSLLIFFFQVAPIIQGYGLRPELGERLGLADLNNTVNRPMRQPGIPYPTPLGIVRLESRVSSFLYLLSFASLFGTIASLLAGLSLMNLLKKKEHRELSKAIVDTMTTPDEKKVLKALEDSGGELTQSELVRQCNLSKVRVHRIVKRLEQHHVVSKYPYGVTNKIKLEQIAK